MLTIEQTLYIIIPVTPLTAQKEEAQCHIDEAAEQNLKNIVGEKGELVSFEVLESRVPCVKTEAGYMRKDAPESATYQPQDTRAFYYSYQCQIRIPTLGIESTKVGDLTNHSFDTESDIVRVQLLKRPGLQGKADGVAIDLSPSMPPSKESLVGLKAIPGTESETREFRREAGGLWRRVL